MGGFLSIYLNDHLAGSALGVELARRLASSNRDSAEFGSALGQVRAEIETDKETLERLMERLQVRRGTVKPAAAWVAEKLGRLKLNGQLRGYSPLSRLVELEGLCIGITGKIELWAALGSTLGPQWEEFDFEQLAQRAIRQREAVEQLHRRAATLALSA
ncbi:MAG: hypothetical protein QOF13_2560 [Solirubrobacterales bacterium]|nr:hypothetical protein [Solirubrobacterales bacterium]